MWWWAASALAGDCTRFTECDESVVGVAATIGAPTGLRVEFFPQLEGGRWMLSIEGVVQGTAHAVGLVGTIGAGVRAHLVPTAGKRGALVLAPGLGIHGYFPGADDGCSGLGCLDLTPNTPLLFVYPSMDIGYAHAGRVGFHLGLELGASATLPERELVVSPQGAVVTGARF